MELTYSTIALLFPAIPLMFLVYGNTSAGIAARLREILEKVLEADVTDDVGKRLRSEAIYLSKRLTLLRLAQIFSGLTFLLNIGTLFSIYAEDQAVAQALFACAVIMMMISIVTYLIEISISASAVRTVMKIIK
jgi:hypothetical protein